MADYIPNYADYVSQADRAKAAEAAKNNPAAGVPMRKVGNDQLDKNAFLLLLITQMKYQDPMNPVEDKEFIAQMAQFSALEQMQNMSKSTDKSQAFGMMGKYVDAQVYNEQTAETINISGKVVSVIMKSGEPYLIVSAKDGEAFTEKEVALADVIEVYDDPYSTALNESSAVNSFKAQNEALIGKFIQAIQYDKDKNPIGFVEGKVDQVKMIDGVPYLIVNGKPIYKNDVISVAGEKLLIDKNISYVNTAGNVVQGVISDVKVSKDGVSLVIDGTNVVIDKIDAISEALKSVGNSVKTSTISGVVDNVVIRDKVPYFVIGGVEVLASTIV